MMNIVNCKKLSNNSFRQISLLLGEIDPQPPEDLLEQHECYSSDGTHRGLIFCHHSNDIEERLERRVTWFPYDVSDLVVDFGEGPTEVTVAYLRTLYIDNKWMWVADIKTL